MHIHLMWHSTVKHCGLQNITLLAEYTVSLYLKSCKYLTELGRIDNETASVYVLAILTAFLLGYNNGE